MTIPYGVVADETVIIAVSARPLVNWELPADLSREAPCEFCGHLVHPMRRPVDWNADEFTICPLSDWAACQERERARARAVEEAAAREAKRAAGVNAVAVMAPAAEEETSPSVPEQGRVRASQARKTLLGDKPEPGAP
jgi:hypothetical protein